MTPLQATRRYWDENVTNWQVATQEHGTLAFFAEIENYRFAKLHYLPRLVDFSGYKGKKLLDVGCGLGNDTARFAAGGAITTGIDLSPRAVALSRRNFELRNLPGRFEQMDGGNMDFHDESFDIIYCHTVLHFAYNPQAIVREIYRVLRPGGEAVLMVINRKSWLMRLHRLIGVKIDYLDAPVFNACTISEFGGLLTPFPQVQIIPERFPVKTIVHAGVKGFVYNMFFVRVFNFLPRWVTRSSGHHLIAFCRK